MSDTIRYYTYPTQIKLRRRTPLNPQKSKRRFFVRVSPYARMTPRIRLPK